MTKPISAQVVLQLASQGRLGLDEPMAPTWTDPDIAGDERRLLLDAASGLEPSQRICELAPPDRRRAQLQARAGRSDRYSGEGYEYVARFAQEKMHTDFEALAQKQIFDPLDMRDTAYTRRAWFEGRIAEPADAQGKFLKPTIADRWVASDLLYTTPSDYAKFMLSVMNTTDLTPAIAAERDRVQASRKADMCAARRRKAVRTISASASAGRSTASRIRPI